MAAMQTDDATRAWLKQELVALLGFPEVDDILSYILTEFKTQGEVAPYLTELLGVPQARAQAIASRLFASAASAGTSSAKKQPKQQQKKQQVEQAAPLVPVPTQTNSRIKQAKIKKPSKLLHSRIINCLQCGRIERNAARRCAFCDTELRYEELDDDMMDQAAQDHMKRLVDLDESGASRTTVLDTEQVFYDQVETTDRLRQPIVLNLDLENRSFQPVDASSSVVLTANQELPKDARELLQNIQKQLTKGQRGSRDKAEAPALDSIVVEDEYNALYV